MHPTHLLLTLLLTPTILAHPQWAQWTPTEEPPAPQVWWTPDATAAPTPTPTATTSTSLSLDTSESEATPSGGITTITRPPSTSTTDSSSTSSPTSTSTTSPDEKSNPKETEDEDDEEGKKAPNADIKLLPDEPKNATEFTQFMTKGKGEVLGSDGGSSATSGGKEKVWWVLMGVVGVVGVWGV